MTQNPSDSGGPPLAIAVVSWNTCELLAACLRSLQPDVDSGRAEVWVVDNNSTDGSVEAVRRDFPWANLIAKERNLGFGAAVNLVADRTASEWIGAANADLALGPGALRTLLLAGRDDARVGAVAPRLVLPSGETQHSVHSFPTVRLAATFATRAYRIIPGLGERLCLEGHWNPDRRRYVDWAHGALLLIRREAWEHVGGFDDRQWMYAEDLDIAWRLHRAGWRVLYEAAARVRHEVGASTRQAFGDERIERYMGATYAWMVRRRGALVTWSYALVNIAGLAANLALIWPRMRVQPHRWVEAHRVIRAHLRAHRRALRSPSRLRRSC